MPNIVNISEAASIALHSLVLIGSSEKYINVNEIAKKLGSSKHHVAKVMQQLSKRGYVKSYRGPTGGFVLNKKPEDIKFINIYEEIEGELTVSHCSFENHQCEFNSCILKCVTRDMTKLFKEYMESQTVAMHLDLKG